MVPRPRSPTTRPRSSSSRRTSSRRASRAPRSGSGCAPRRARDSSAGIDPNGTASGSDAGDGALRRSRGARRPRRVRSTCTRSRSTGPASRCAPARVNRLLGTERSATEIRDLLVPLGIETDGAGDDFTAVAPTFRPDLEREIDIVEEVGRRVGLAEHRRARCRPIPRRSARSPSSSRSAASLADVLVGAGYDEAYTLPLLAPADLARAGFATDAVDRGREPAARGGVALAPASPARAAARGRVQRGARHARRRAVRTRLRVRAARRPAPPCRTNACTWPRCAPDGRGAPRTNRIATVAPHDAVAVVQAVAEELRLADWRLEAAAAPGFHPVRTAAVVVDGAPAGFVGEIAPDVVAAFDLPASGRRLRARRRALRAGSRRAAHLRRGVAVPGVGRSTSRSSSTTPCPPAPSSTRSGPRPVTSRNGSSSSTCSVPTRSVTGA